ncbi:MAG: MFS transporter [Patescibacteria group bacterium]
MIPAPSIGDFFLKHTNPVIRWLIIGDVTFYAAVGLLAPIFAIFIEESVVGAGPEVVGIATAIFLITRSMVQIPAAQLVDRIIGDADDFWFMFLSLLLSAIVPLAYLIISTPLELYLVQFIYGALLAFNYPSFYALFTKYIVKNREATAWSIYQTFLDLMMAAAAAVGGVAASYFGFTAVILGVVVIGVLGSLLLVPIRSRLRINQPTV